MNSTIAKKFLALPSTEKELFLARSGHHLTVEMRAALNETGTESDSEKVAAINEALHLITGKLRDLLLQTDAQYPDDVFLEILWDRGHKCEKELDRAMTFAAGRVRHGTK